MPWNNEGGGPWQPKNQGPKNQGPWGQGPGGGNNNDGGGNKGGGQPPDLEELLRRGKDRFKNVLPPGGGGSGLGGISGKGFVVLGLLALLGYALTGIYTVKTNEVALEMQFGKFVGKKGEGLNYNWPYPIGGVIKVPFLDVKNTEIGRTTTDPRRAAQNTDSLMLTSDENIVDIGFSVQWRISPIRPEDYVFAIQNVDGTIKAVAESAMREVIGQRQLQNVLPSQVAAVQAATPAGTAAATAATQAAVAAAAASAASAQSDIQDKVQKAMQTVLDSYKAGVVIDRVNVTRIAPPQDVLAAFREVQAAVQDQVRLRNEAETYASRIVPEARGQAERTIQEAQAYRERTVAEAQGSASRFRQVYEDYRKAPDVTRQRIFLETMERVFGGMDKIIMDNGPNGQGAVPYLPLNELQRRPQQQQPGAIR
ncbi:MAG: protease modulator HflK [Beijerinckiaceae bacterium]